MSAWIRSSLYSVLEWQNDEGYKEYERDYEDYDRLPSSLLHYAVHLGEAQECTEEDKETHSQDVTIV